MDLAKDILDVAEKVGQAPGLTIASSIVISILNTVEKSKNNTVRLRMLAHSLANQLIDISENMDGKWDDAPLTLKRAVDEYDAFLVGMLKSITRLSQYSRLRAFLLAGECEAEITRLEKRVVDVRSTITLMIGMNLSVAMNQVRTSLASYNNIGREVHSGMRRPVHGAPRMDLESDELQTTPDLSLFTREDFQVLNTISRQATYDLRCSETMTLTFHRAERCSTGRAILIKTFEGNDPRRVRNQFKKELELGKKSLNSALPQIIGWSGSTAQLPFHVYHAPGGIIETFESWAKRTLRSNPVETIFGLYDMRNSCKELIELERSQLVHFNYVFYNAVVNIQQHGDRPRFSLIYTGKIDKRRFSGKEYPSLDCRDYKLLSFHHPGLSDNSIYDMDPAATLMKLFAGGAEAWFMDVHGIEALFKGNYRTIDPLQLGPALLEAGWLSTTSMILKPQGSMRLGDVGYLVQDGHFEVVANLHTRLISRTGGLPGWTYEKFPHAEREPEDEYTVVTHADTFYRRYQNVITPSTTYPFSRMNQHRVGYNQLCERHAWKTLQQEAFHIIEENHLSISPHDLQLVTSVTNMFTFFICRRHHWIREVGSSGQEECLPDPPTITVYEFEREGSLSVLDSGVPELNAQIFYSFQENIDGLDTIEMQHPETGDILMRQNLDWPIYIEYLQLPLGVTRMADIEEVPD